ncbi:ABC transporter solute-binding protein [Kitasatospora sp. MMS16-BH015]|uniref:N-acetylglucosamine/diacetylchitobiose ABC transporter substrate-binding protein n=1 Tax=Kitasatospora sp. MMS16-BH015 TaxID=2018025 RepID=UPI000CA3D169|nr:N-acetylglucosamine/diacetylchitobiose ABC transporter substrate-binding protein [Kitasatospora sp. MMS16-BH015]AUG77239.1 ABC transporter solute-binding protein [Kitasatospora sp. MMS16-BH015]
MSTGAGYNRRELLRRAAGLTALAVTGGPLLAACAGGGGGTTGGATAVASSATNPLGVDGSAPLEVVIFKGGFGDDYAKAFEGLYAKTYSAAKITHTPTQDITGLLQPRFNGGSPPDVVDDSGAKQIKLDVLHKAGQLADLTALLDAPYLDDPSRKVRDVLQPGTVEHGSFDGKMYSLNYVYSVSGLWYSGKLFKEKGWTAPKTWAEFITLCGTIKAAGVAPFCHQGKYPYYINVAIMDLLARQGGREIITRVDQLDTTVWDGPEAKAAISAIYQLVDQDYLLPGTNGMTHTEAQTAWNQYKAAFVPCGSWLENEQLKLTPDDFEMTFLPMPSLPGDKLPPTSLRAGADEPFIVPAKAKNVAGGMEFLRMMLTKAGAGQFAQQANAVTVLKDGIGPEVKLRPGTKSAVAALGAAGTEVFNYDYPNTQSAFDIELGNASTELMANRIKPEEWLKRAKAAAEKAKKA